MSRTIVICATIIFIALMGSFVFLSYLGKETASLVTFALGLATAVVPTLASYLKSHQTGQAVQHVLEDVQAVKEQTNGPFKDAVKKMNAVADEFREQTNGQSK